jgi:hypothetical protein
MSQNRAHHSLQSLDWVLTQVEHSRSDIHSLPVVEAAGQMIESFLHSLFAGNNHLSWLVGEIQWMQLGSGIEQVTVLASDVLAVVHNLAASAVLVVDYNTEKVGLAASAAVGSNHSALVA